MSARSQRSLILVYQQMSVSRIIAVGSGKGGVGKSSVALGLAQALVRRGRDVGLLDADLYGPDIPLLLGITVTRPAKYVMLGFAPEHDTRKMTPLEHEGLKLMSLQFLVSERQAFALPGPMEYFLLGRLWSGVEWGDLDYLIVDLPPGTGDISQGVLEVLPIDGAIVVVTPHRVSHLDTRKLLEILRRDEVRVLGGVENMVALRCPHCEGEVQLFPSASEGATIWSDGVIRLVGLPFDQTGTWPGLAAQVNGVIRDRLDQLADQVLEHLPVA